MLLTCVGCVGDVVAKGRRGEHWCRSAGCRELWERTVVKVPATHYTSMVLRFLHTARIAVCMH